MDDEEEGTEPKEFFLLKHELEDLADFGAVAGDAVAGVGEGLKKEARVADQYAGEGQGIAVEGFVPIDPLAEDVEGAGEHFLVAGVVFPHALEEDSFCPDFCEDDGDDVVALAVAELEGQAVDGLAAGAVDLLPEALSLYGALGFARPADIGYGEEAEEAEGIGIFEKPAGDICDIGEIPLGDGDGGCGH